MGRMDAKHCSDHVKLSFVWNWTCHIVFVTYFVIYVRTTNRWAVPQRKGNNLSQPLYEVYPSFMLTNPQDRQCFTFNNVNYWFIIIVWSVMQWVGSSFIMLWLLNSKMIDSLSMDQKRYSWKDLPFTYSCLGVGWNPIFILFGLFLISYCTQYFNMKSLICIISHRNSHIANVVFFSRHVSRHTKSKMSFKIWVLRWKKGTKVLVV